jgi:UDP-N-acetylmuramoylalanine--D-glutamate ligase
MTTQPRALIFGLARQGSALARHLVQKGWQVRLTDSRPAEQLTDLTQALAGLEIEFVLGSHPLWLLEHIDLIGISGGVPLDLPILQTARAQGIPFTNDTQLLLDEVCCPVIGITGSAGKTTTTTLVGLLAQAGYQAGHSWVGGNIGNPLLNTLGQIQPIDRVILELSSFQLELLHRSPQIAAVLNITPNHLDRHGTMVDYTSAKNRILHFQQPNDQAILNWEDPGSRALQPNVRCKLWWFGWHDFPAGAEGCTVRAGQIGLWESGAWLPLCDLNDIQLRGDHNVRNVLAAATIAAAAGWDLRPLPTVLREFNGVAHRLELVRERKGVRWYNDSIATAPERTLAALRAFPNEKCVLLLGGRDKKLPWTELAQVAQQQARTVIVFGEAAALITEALQSVTPPPPFVQVPDLTTAVTTAAQHAQPGDVVLLSPGCTSFDQYVDFAARGQHFKTLVTAL